MIESIQPTALALPAGHYAPAVRAGGFVFISGQLPVDRDGRPHPEWSFEDQVRLVLGNIGSTLQACSLGIDRLVQVRVYVTDIANWPAFNALYAQWLGQHRPARAVVPVQVLHYGCALEVECVALATA